MAFTIAAESAVPQSIAGGIEPTAEATSHGYRLGLNPLCGGRVASTPLPDWFRPGTPMAADPYSPGGRVLRLVTGNLNNDGNPDIALGQG